MSDFNFFEGAATESADVPRITVRRGGILVLSRAAVDQLGEGVTHVQVGFNPKARAIGLRGAAEGSPGCYRLREQGSSRLVDGKRIFAHHGLKADKAERFEVQDFGDGVIGITLPAPTATEAPTKAKAAKK